LSLRLCKYGCNTEISWHTKLNKFVETDGTIHDRPRCESQRPSANERVQQSTVTTTTGAQHQQQQQQQQHQTPLQKQEMKGDNWQIPREDWEKVTDLLSKISHNIALMVAHYDGLVEQQRLLTRMVTKPLDEKLAEREARYDQDREDGVDLP
jgi:hypothetical protein